MGESRQVRRARERAEAKAARRGPQPTVERVLEVELNRYVEPVDDDLDQAELDEYVSWGAEWWLKGSSSSTMHSEPDLQTLIDILTDDLVGRDANYVFHLEWTLRGDPPADGTVQDAVDRTGVVLPTRWPAE